MQRQLSHPTCCIYRLEPGSDQVHHNHYASLGSNMRGLPHGAVRPPALHRHREPLGRYWSEHPAVLYLSLAFLRFLKSRKLSAKLA